MTTIRRVWYVRRVHLRVFAGWALGLVCAVPTLLWFPPAAYGFIWFGLALIVASEVLGGALCCFGVKTVANCPVCGDEMRIWSVAGGGYCSACHSRLQIRGGTVTPAGL